MTDGHVQLQRHTMSDSPFICRIWNIMMLFHVFTATLDAGQVAHLFCCQRHVAKEQIHCLGRGKLVPQFHVVKAGVRLLLCFTSLPD